MLFRTLISAAWLVALGTDALAQDLLRPATQPATQRSPEVVKPPPRDEVLILPLHIHVLSDKDRPDLDCKLTDDDVTRILGKVNRVWRFAGIQFHAAPIHREAPFQPEVFDKAKPQIQAGKLGLYRLIAQPATRDLPGIHVYYLHELPPNGVYIGQNLCFVKETASLRRVEGGIDEPIPRVTSHEIGHALGLPHRQDRTNLMASGTTGTTLNEAEVKTARSVARKNKGVLTVAEAEARAAKGVEKDAQSLREFLKTLE